MDKTLYVAYFSSLLLHKMDKLIDPGFQDKKFYPKKDFLKSWVQVMDPLTPATNENPEGSCGTACELWRLYETFFVKAKVCDSGQRRPIRKVNFSEPGNLRLNGHLSSTIWHAKLLSLFLSTSYRLC